MEKEEYRYGEYGMEELLPLVRELARLYTAGQSTSVAYEKARQLMEAVLYCIQEYAKEEEREERIRENTTEERNAPGQEDEVGRESTPKGENAPERARGGKDQCAAERTNARRKKEGLSAESAYKRGYERVIQKVVSTKEIYEEIIPDFNAYKNTAYRETVAEGMPAFFLYYDAKFCPQDHILTLDYPLLKPLQGLCGVDAVYEYLKCVRLEQRFLSAFPPEYILDALGRYHDRYEELLINLCGVVMRNLMAHMIVGRKPGSGNFTEAELNALWEFAVEKTEKERRARMVFLLGEIARNFGEEGQELADYLKKDAGELISGLSYAEGKDGLTALFCVS